MLNKNVGVSCHIEAILSSHRKLIPRTCFGQMVHLIAGYGTSLLSFFDPALTFQQACVIILAIYIYIYIQGVFSALILQLQFILIR